MGFKKSIFNVEYEKIGSLLVYNTASSKLIELDSRDYFNWMTNITKIESKTFEWLVGNGFIVDEFANELCKVMEEYVADSNRIRDPFFRILTTTECNANCGYCFEKGIEKKSMSLETAEKIVHFISRKSKHSDNITIEWFGGEPLVNKRVISHICDNLKKMNPSKKIHSKMTTNGSLFDIQTIKDAQKWNLESVQITLDGTECVHNLVKNYNSSVFNFKQTIKNIHNLISSDVQVTIRINYDENNVLDMLDLIDHLKEEFGNSIQVYGSQIYYVGDVSELCIPSYVESLVVKKLIECNYFRIGRILRRNKATCGLASYSNYMAIDPDGKIFKCIEAITKPSISCIGSIDDFELNIPLIDMWREPVSEERCMRCVYLPMCLGGCVSSRKGLCSMRCFRYKNQIESLIRWIDVNPDLSI